MRYVSHCLKNQCCAIACLFIVTGIAISSCSTGNDDNNEPTMVVYSGAFIPSNAEVTTSASGTTTATLNTETMEVSFEVVWEGLSSPVVGMHFHNDGPVIHGIDGWEAETSGSVSGTVTFSANEASDMAAGDVYTQIHTEDYPGGEVVSPLTKSGDDNNTDPPDGGY